MEAATQRHDRVAAVAHALGVEARKLHRALVGLGARIGKERLPNLLALGGSSRGQKRLVVLGINGLNNRSSTGKVVVSKLGEQRRHLAAMLDIEVIGHVREVVHLRVHGVDHGRGAMA